MVSTSSTTTFDNVFLFLLVISVVLLIAITVTMIYFVIKYNRKKNPTPVNIESNLLLEITWIVIPTALVLAMFYYGWSGFKFMRTVPEGAMTVKATGRMWSWQFEYDNGIKSRELKVPLGKPVKLLITSQDVLHSLFIPAYRIKEDAVPGMETYLWFLPDKAGEFDLFCSEYCGVDHSSMVSKVIVTGEDAFNTWYREAGKKAAVTGKETQLKGHELVEEKGCLDCHSLDGSIEIGPSFKGLFGRRVLVTSSGKEREVIADENYIRNSILHPDADVVKGFDDIMPPQEGNVSEEEINEIIRYLKGLK
ncbi:MAG: cytochrome c oxidase subunit II [Nitrospiraceae bacterium]|nr:MAG: cytochrome c oxidase subunit II [Nitrospiraceae bacterium]